MTESPEVNNVEGLKNAIAIDSNNLPMTILYKGKKYILILTKNDKLILNKYDD